MKRSLRTIIIVAVLLVLLIGAYFFLKNMKKNGSGEILQQNVENKEYLIDAKIDSVDYIKYNTGVANYTVYNREVPTIEGYSSHIIDVNKLESILVNTVSIYYKQNMGKQTDLSKYGLDNEDEFVLFKLKNGDEKKIIIGNPTHVSGEYYVRNSGDDVVYTLSSQSSALLMYPPELLRDETICIIDSYSISDFDVFKSGVKVLGVKKDEKFAKDSGFIQSNYIIQHPYKNVEANNDTIEGLFQHLTSVFATEIVEENPKNLSVYGLDKPNIITVKDAKGTSTVKMGKYAEDGTVYMMRNDIPVVYKANCPFYDAVKKLSPDEFVARYIHIFKIKDVESVVVENSFESHVMKITEKSTDSYEYRIDDKIKVEDNFRTAYETVITPIANKIVNQGLSGEEVCRITFTFKNKSVKTFVYHRYDDNNYIVKADNGLVCLVKKDSIDNIFSALR